MAASPADFSSLLAGRRARCTCGRVEPSSVELAFIEYRGEGSVAARERCRACGHFEVAHTQEVRPGLFNVVEQGRCGGFVPHGPYEYDSFYCGHGGWD